MYSVMPGSEGKNLGIKATGKITTEDEEKLIKKANEVIEEFGSINVLCDFTEFKSATAKAEIEDFTWLVNHKSKIDKIGVLGSEEYKGLCEAMVGFLLPKDTKFFAESEIDAAWAWLKE